MSLKAKIFLSIAAVLVAIQFIPVKRDNPKFDKKYEIKAPKEVKALFKRSCYDCHSYETKWPWYSKIAPFSFFVSKHVHDGRAWLNFSVWEKYDEKKKKKLKREIFRSVAFAMPLSMYLWVHKDAKLTKEEKDKIRYWASDGTMVIDKEEKGF